MNSLTCFAPVLLVLACSARAADAPSSRLHVFHHENVLGTSLELKVATPTDVRAGQAESAALTEIDRLAKILSSYDPASEFSRWLTTSGHPVKVSPELFEVLGLFDQWRTRSDGALDPAAEAVCRLWRNAARQQTLPSDSELAAACAEVRHTHWTLDATAQTANHLTTTPLILNSFAKSYIASRAAEATLGIADVSAVVVNIGGDLVVRGQWTEAVQISDPRSDAENAPPGARLRVRNRTVATSGGYRRGVQIGGQWYSHIVDPRTARPTDHVLSATIVAPNATDAGGVATIACVLAPAESLRLAAALPGVECLLITKDGTRLTSPGWSALEEPTIQLASAAGAPELPADPADKSPTTKTNAATWDPVYELVVALELSTVEGRRAKRPFVAVWIEDQDKFSVRTLALWISKPKWLPDLKSWSRSDKLREQAEGKSIMVSVSSATRAPGKYTLKWDGKDNQGKLVKPGKYTVFIEAAREHGTYQLIRQEMEFASVPRKVELKGNVEISSASLDYRRKSDGH